MFRTKRDEDPGRTVWRMSPEHPQGRFVRVSSRPPRILTDAEAHPQSSAASSLDLWCGVDVSEVAIDTLPGELLEAFAAPRPRGSAADTASSDPRDPRAKTR